MARRDADGFWIPEIGAAARPVYLAIADALAADILAGKLAPGTRLPPQRTLAEALAIDFTTVTRAYAEVRKRGLLEGRVGQGTYVRAAAQPSAPVAPGGVVDLSMNLPPRFNDPPLSARMWRGVAALGPPGGLALLLSYPEPGGTRVDRGPGASLPSGPAGQTPGAPVPTTTSFSASASQPQKNVTARPTGALGQPPSGDVLRGRAPPLPPGAS